MDEMKTIMNRCVSTFVTSNSFNWCTSRGWNTSKTIMNRCVSTFATTSNSFNNWLVHFSWMKYIKNNHYEQMCEYLHHIISHIKFFQKIVHFSLMKWNQLQTDVWVVPSSHQEILSTSALLVDEILTDVWVHSTIIVLLCFIIFNQSS